MLQRQPQDCGLLMTEGPFNLPSIQTSTMQVTAMLWNAWHLLNSHKRASTAAQVIPACLVLALCILLCMQGAHSTNAVLSNDLHQVPAMQARALLGYLFGLAYDHGMCLVGVKM